MSSEVAAVIDHVGKCYHVYNKPIDRLKQSLLLGKTRLYHEFWALRDISFTIRRGQTVGIVGCNGSGKSTLLQMLCGVLQPTIGNIRVNGRIGALLELGAGFNPEETGRENIMINAAIRGVPAGDLPALYERIAAFADIGEFINQPIKLYSSGMVVRLGFALQISIPCEILIIDEALAVGDELFQRRCYSALEQFQESGGTILFVSHAASVVKQLCSTAIFLDRGQLIEQGECKTVVDNYQKFLYMREPRRSAFREALLNHRALAEPAGQSPAAATAAKQCTSAEFDASLAPLTTIEYAQNGAVISNCRIETLDGSRVNILHASQRYRFQYDVEFTCDCFHVLFGAVVKTTSGLELGGTAHQSSADALARVPSGSRYHVSFEFAAHLLPGIYYFNCGVTGASDQYAGFLARIVDALAFRVHSNNLREVTGHIDFQFQPRLQTVEDASPVPALQ